MNEFIYLLGRKCGRKASKRHLGYNPSIFICVICFSALILGMLLAPLWTLIAFLVVLIIISVCLICRK